MHACMHSFWLIHNARAAASVHMNAHVHACMVANVPLTFTLTPLKKPSPLTWSITHACRDGDDQARTFQSQSYKSTRCLPQVASRSIGMHRYSAGCCDPGGHAHRRTRTCVRATSMRIPMTLDRFAVPPPHGGGADVWEEPRVGGGGQSTHQNSAISDMKCSFPMTGVRNGGSSCPQ